MAQVESFRKCRQKALRPFPQPRCYYDRVRISEAFKNDQIMARAGKDISFGEVMTKSVREAVGPRVRDEVQAILSNYDFKAKTWAGLNKDRARQANASVWFPDRWQGR